MAVQKAELDKKLTQEQLAEVQRIEEMFDAELREKYTGGSINLSLPKEITDKVKEEVIRRYTAAGWKMSYKYDQRESCHWMEVK